MLPWPMTLVEVSIVIVTVGTEKAGLLEMEGEPTGIECLGEESSGREPEASEASIV